MTNHIDWIYETVKEHCEGIDAIYEDYIIRIVGEFGLNVLEQNRLVERCGVVNGRQLYALVEKREYVK